MRAIIRFVLNHVPRRYIQRGVHFVMPLAGLAYAGRGVECPICGGRYRKFMPYGYVVSRDNALCPRCLSLERHRLLWLYVSERTRLLDPASGLRMLHIAPERCFMKRFEKSLGDNYITADLESPLAKVKMDIQQIPFPDNEFDVIFCNHILEHVDDDRLALREMFRVMRSGGWGVMLSPITYGKATTYEDPTITTPESRERAFGQRDHAREYGADYPERLREAGFRVECLDLVGELGAERAKLHGLRRETVYVVHKP